MQTQISLHLDETFPPENTNGTRSHTHIHKTNGYKQYVIQHLVPTTTNLRVKTVQIQDKRMNEIHFA